jgi:hypothetical protein
MVRFSAASVPADSVPEQKAEAPCPREAVAPRAVLLTPARLVLHPR